MSQSPEELIRLALAVASSRPSNDLPVAALIIDRVGSVVASSYNCVVANADLTDHAELLVIRSLDLTTFKRNAKNMTLVVTLEPCPMCAWAIRCSRIGRLIFGAYNPQYGAAGSVYDFLRDGRYGPGVQVIGGVLEEECQKLLGSAFSEIRNNSAW